MSALPVGYRVNVERVENGWIITTEPPEWSHSIMHNVAVPMATAQSFMPRRHVASDENILDVIAKAIVLDRVS